MRILVVAATDVRTSDAPFLLQLALERGGHHVMLLPIDSGLPLPAEVGHRVGGLDDPVYRAGFQRHARKVAAAACPDAVLLYGSNWSLDRDTVGFFRRKLGAQVGLWEVNQRIFNGDQARCMPLYDHVFCLDSYYLPIIRAAGLACVEHLCAAADPGEHRPLTLSDEEQMDYGADLSFIGTHQPERAALLGALDGVSDRIRVYGHRWERAGPPVSEWVRQEPVYGRKKIVIYGASRLSFHVRGPHMINGENFRVFEVAACGGVPLARSAPDLLQCFDPGSEVLLFEGPDDLRRTVACQLADTDRLTTIGAAARRRVLAEHTYDHRAAVILEHFEHGRHCQPH